MRRVSFTMSRNQLRVALGEKLFEGRISRRLELLRGLLKELGVHVADRHDLGVGWFLKFLPCKSPMPLR